MSQDTDIARVVAVLRTPGLRYRSFGNQPVRSASGASQADSLLVLPPATDPDSEQPPAGNNATLALAAEVENLLKKQLQMENSPLAASGGDALPNPLAPSSAGRPEAAEDGPSGPSPLPAAPLNGLAALLKEPVALPPARSTPLPAARPLPPVSPAPTAAAVRPAMVPAPLGGAASLLAALQAAEVQPQPAASSQNLPSAVAPAPPPLLGMLGSGQASSVAASMPAPLPPLLATLSALPPPAAMPAASAPPAAVAPPAGVGEILRGLGRPPAPPAPAKPPEKAVPEVLRTLRLTGLS
ncbi:hypothetical protein QMO56_11195 [Roseomonas sp. E05]|uniref:hypothetical protein n=1 Tax=Roseomonas sp. E05 TaxID=3046310 RepID=UPI0024BA6770|nr:hypothetical protein [Roseomonas sp. E05]MDJ0388678.1 hypothetical protein [Roseomonas sp. E05]